MRQERIREIDRKLAWLYLEVYEAYRNVCVTLPKELEKKRLRRGDEFMRAQELGVKIENLKKELEELKNPKPKGLLEG